MYRGIFESGYLKYFFICFLIASISMYFWTENLESQSNKLLISSEFSIALDSVDNKTGTTYFYSGADKLTLGKLGFSLRWIVEPGDSLIKEADSTYLFLVAIGENKNVVSRRKYYLE